MFLFFAYILAAFLISFFIICFVSFIIWLIYYFEEGKYFQFAYRHSCGFVYTGSGSPNLCEGCGKITKSIEWTRGTSRRTFFGIREFVAIDNTEKM